MMGHQNGQEAVNAVAVITNHVIVLIDGVSSQVQKFIIHLLLTCSLLMNSISDRGRNNLSNQLQCIWSSWRAQYRKLTS